MNNLRKLKTINETKILPEKVLQFLFSYLRFKMYSIYIFVSFYFNLGLLFKSANVTNQ